MAAMRGALAETTVAVLCRELAERQATGVAEFTTDRGSGQIVFRDGLTIWASSPAPRARLGDRLVNAGLVDEQHLSEVLEEQEQGSPSHVKLGALLVQRGLAGRDAIRVFVQEQILDAVLELVHWDATDHTWHDDAPPEDEVAVELAVDDLLVEVARRQREWDQVSRLIPDLGMVPEFVTGASSAAASLEPDEFAMLASIDGHRTIRDLADDLGYGEFEAARLVYGLVLLGIVRIGDLPADAEKDGRTPGEDEVPAASSTGQEPPAFVAWDEPGTPTGSDSDDEDELGPAPWVVADVDAEPDDVGEEDLADWIIDSADGPMAADATEREATPTNREQPDGNAGDVDVGAALDDALFGEADPTPGSSSPPRTGDDVGTILSEVGRADADDPSTEASGQPTTGVSEFLRELSRLALDDDPDDEAPSPPSDASSPASSEKPASSGPPQGSPPPPSERQQRREENRSDQRSRWRLFGRKNG